jgi:hypothetical protein
MPPCVNTNKQGNRKGAMTKKTSKTSKNKTCSKCKAIQPLTNFYDKRANCKDCHRAIAREQSAHWNKINPFKRKKRNLRWYYNLSAEDFFAMIFLQRFQCADCATPFSAKTVPCLDHNHRHCSRCRNKRSCGSPDAIRGVVCHACNVKRSVLDRKSRLKVSA